MEQEGGDDDDDGDDDEDPETQAEADLTSTAVPSKSSKKKKNKKKKKKTSADEEVGTQDEELDPNSNQKVTSDEAGNLPVTSTSQPSKPKPKKKKKANATSTAPSNSSKNLDDMSMDELSALLASSAATVKSGDQTAAAESVSLSKSPLANLRRSLLVNPSLLDPGLELRRTFGAAAMKAYSAAEGGGTSTTGMSAGRARAMAQSRDLNRKARCILIQPGESWPAISRSFTGLEMRTKEVQDGKDVKESGKGKEKAKASALGSGKKHFWWEHSR